MSAASEGRASVGVEGEDSEERDQVENTLM
jgi:hypothetical protein